MPTGKRKGSKSDKNNNNNRSRSSGDHDDPVQDQSSSHDTGGMNVLFHRAAVDGIPLNQPPLSTVGGEFPVPRACAGVVRWVSTGPGGVGGPGLPRPPATTGRPTGAVAATAPLLSTATSLPRWGTPADSLAVAPTAFLARFVTPPDEYTPAKRGAVAPAREPRPNDVVCGRGKGSYNCPGNRKFRAIVKKYMPAYTAAKTKVDKGAVLQTVLTAFTDATRGRFVRWDKAGRGYVEIPLAEAREKVGPAMREALAAAELVEGRQEAQQAFQEKHQSLLERQRAIFDKMVDDNR